VKALTLSGNLKFVRDAPLPRREGEALVQVICAGICNTDLEIVKGYAGFQGIPGHEFVGRVVESPDASLLGRRVVGEINVGCGSCALCLKDDPRHCAGRTVMGIKGRDGAFAQFLSLPVRNLIELPDALSDDTAVFVEPLAAAFNILEQVTPTSSSEVAVVGDGKLAQLVVLAMAQIGCSLTVIGRHNEKLEIARDFGATVVLLDTPSTVRERSSRFDVVIEASGSASGLATALGIVRPRGTIVLKSTHHGTTPFEMSQVVVNELRIIGSRCGRFRPALEFLANSNVDLSAMVSKRLPLGDGLRAFEEAAAPDNLKIILEID
jgi:threonine dehydrogenase-like Zn-dependent dehydrogenase